MNKFIKKIGKEDVLLTKPDIVAFLVVGSDGDMLLSSCDYVNNIQPALVGMIDKLKDSDEAMADYVKDASFYITAAVTVADVYSQKQKSVVGSKIVHSVCMRYCLVGTVGSLYDAGDELACGKIQEGIFEIYGKDTKSTWKS